MVEAHILGQMLLMVFLKVCCELYLCKVKWPSSKVLLEFRNICTEHNFFFMEKLQMKWKEVEIAHKTWKHWKAVQKYIRCACNNLYFEMSRFQGTENWEFTAQLLFLWFNVFPSLRISISERIYKVFLLWVSRYMCIYVLKNIISKFLYLLCTYEHAFVF